MQKIFILLVIIFISNYLISQTADDLTLVISERLYDNSCLLNLQPEVVDSQNKSGFKFLLNLPILLYQTFISSQLKPRCYFHPSCSQFSLEAINHFGVAGVFMGADRIMRCNPLSENNYPLYKKTGLLYDPIESYVLINEKGILKK